MKNKKNLKMMASLLLVGAIGVGATLALLSDQTDPITNTFTIGEGYHDEDGSPALVLDEENLGDEENADSNFDGRTTQGNSYVFTPGGSYDKDPDVHLKADSIESYVFVKVEGLQDLLNATNEDGDKYYNSVDFDHRHWILADYSSEANDGYDSVYVFSVDGRTPAIVSSETYTEIETDQNGVKYLNLAKLFTKLDPNNDITKVGEEGSKLADIEITAIAVQASNITYAQARADAITKLG